MEYNICCYCGTNNNIDSDKCKSCNKCITDESYKRVIFNKIRIGGIYNLIYFIALSLFNAFVIYLLYKLNSNFSDLLNFGGIISILILFFLFVFSVVLFIKGFIGIFYPKNSLVIINLKKYGDIYKRCRFLLTEKNINKEFEYDGVVFSRKLIIKKSPLKVIDINSNDIKVDKFEVRNKYGHLTERIRIIGNGCNIKMKYDPVKIQEIGEFLYKLNPNIQVGFPILKFSGHRIECINEEQINNKKV